MATVHRDRTMVRVVRALAELPRPVGRAAITSYPDQSLAMVRKPLGNLARFRDTLTLDNTAPAWTRGCSVYGLSYCGRTSPRSGVDVSCGRISGVTVAVSVCDGVGVKDGVNVAVAVSGRVGGRVTVGVRVTDGVNVALGVV